MTWAREGARRATAGASFAFVLSACAPDGTTPGQDRAGRAEGAEDAGLTEAGVDRNGGRDASAASCFAACQNTSFTCQAKDGAAARTTSRVELTLDATGCTGSVTIGTSAAVALRLDCVEAQVCIGGSPGSTPTDCVDATFSAFTYAFTPEDGAFTLCTRD